MTPAYTALGKEVLRDGEHYADAATAEAAAEMATALSILALIHGLYTVVDPRPTDTERLAS